MICCTNTKNALFYASIEEVPPKIWNYLQCEKNIYFHPNFFKSLEKNHPTIIFSYIVLVDENQNPIAFTSIKIIDFFINSIQNNYNFLKNIGKKLRIVNDNVPLKLLISGNIFVSGEHGIFIKQDQDKQKVIQQLAKAINHFVNSNKELKNKINAFLLKDFVNESLFITEKLKSVNYNPFSVEPNMVLHINTNWQTFDDYLASIKTKFRVKARKAFTQSKAIRIEEVSLDNIDQQLPKMSALYKKVAKKAAFNLADFNLATYKDLKEHFAENYILKTYWLQDTMVGFISGVINNSSLDAHFVGIDYALNREHAIYQRMLYDYIEIAIHKKLSLINFGRTASEIKSSVGAIPQDLTMYLRHKKRITNKILKLFLQRIQPTPFPQKYPFKTLENSYENQ